MFSNGRFIGAVSSYITRLSRNSFNPYQKLCTTSSKPNVTTVVNVLHDLKNKIFYVKSNSETAKLNYNKNGNLITILHTEVPKEFQGKGIGKELAKVNIKY